MTRSALLLLPLPFLNGHTIAPGAEARPDSPSVLRNIALERKLLRAALRGAPVVLGTPVEPYEPSAFIRSPLEVLRRAEGLEVSIVTRSSGLLRDLDLLADLDRRCSVLVDVALPAINPALARRIEPASSDWADPSERLEMVARLAAEGIAVRVLWTPVLPGVNDREAELRPLLAAAREAGACDVLAGAAPARRLAWLSPGRRGTLPHAAFRRLRLEHGFPRALPGRG